MEEGEENVAVDVEMATMTPTIVSMVSVKESEDDIIIVVTSVPVIRDMTTLRPAAAAGGTTLKFDLGDTTLKPVSTARTDGEAEITTSKADAELAAEAEVTDVDKPISMLTTQKPTYRRNENCSLMHDAVNICIHFFKFDFPEKAVMFYEELLNYHMTKKMIPDIDVEGNLVRPNETIETKMERFVFDKCNFSNNSVVGECLKNDEP